MKNYLEREEFPFLLQQIPDLPRGLYCYGDKALLQNPCISIVGSRQPTKSTSRLLRIIVPAAINAGYTIVSGCATGVDFEVHQMAVVVVLVSLVMGLTIDTQVHQLP